MMMRRLFMTLVLLAVMATPTLAADEGLVSRAFELDHKDPQRVVETIQGLLSRDGSYTIQPGQKTIVVTDKASVLDRVAGVIRKLDVPPRNYTLQLTLVSASRSANPPAVPAGLEEISRKMSGVLRFNTFEKIGTASARGNEGANLVVDVDGYHAAFNFAQFDPLSESLRVENFRLDRTRSGQASDSSLIRTNLNLRVGQTVVLGASRQPESGKALMIVLLVEENR